MSLLAPKGLRSYTVFYTDGDGIRVVPLDGSKAAVVVPGAGELATPVRVTGGVAFIRAGVAYFSPASATGQLRPLGSADHLVPALGGGELVGLASGAASITVAFVNILGGPTLPSVPLPTGFQPIAQVDTGVLVSGSDGKIRVWLNKTRTVGPAIGNYPVAILGDNVAWRSDIGCNGDAECSLHLINTSTGADRVIRPPPGHGGFMGGGAFSPDGRLFAGFVSAPSASSPQAQLVVVDLGASIDVLIDDSVIPVGEPIGSAVWVPDGSAVLFGGLHGPLHAVETGNSRATTLGVPSSYSFTVTQRTFP